MKVTKSNYVYVNRKDWMVKINGQRVESFEVENVMKEIEGVGITDVFIQNILTQ